MKNLYESLLSSAQLNESIFSTASVAKDPNNASSAVSNIILSDFVGMLNTTGENDPSLYRNKYYTKMKDCDVDIRDLSIKMGIP